MPVPGPHRRRRTGWVRLPAALLVLAGLAAAAVAGFYVGQASRDVPVWDPLWVRAYLRQPMDRSVPQAGPWAAGYYVDYDRSSLAVLRAVHAHLDQVVAFSYQVAGDGTVTGRDPAILLGLVHPRKLVLLFANQGFAPEAADRILTDPRVRERALDGILAKVKALDAAGVQIDFEGVPPERRPELTRFIAELSRRLRAQGRTLSMAVPAKVGDDPRHGWSGAFDYPALAPHLDQMYIMAYDEHWPGGEPGPVASLPWVEQVVRYAISVVPAGKIVLGVPGYGYDWGPDGGRAYGSRAMAERLARLGVEAVWDPVAGENRARYERNGEVHEVWFPDGRSFQAKLDLARRYNLRGIALWRLGLEPDAVWPQITAFRTGRLAAGGAH